MLKYDFFKIFKYLLVNGVGIYNGCYSTKFRLNTKHVSQYNGTHNKLNYTSGV